MMRRWKPQDLFIPTLVLSSLFFSCCALAGHVSTLQDIGSVDILYPNNLTATAATGALLINTPTTFTNASAACSFLNEELLPQSNLNNDSYPSLISLLYDRSPLDAFWVDGSESPGACIAYVKRTQGFGEVDCNTTLPALCTQSAAPFTIGANDPSPPASSVPDTLKIIVESKDSTITGYSMNLLAVLFSLNCDVSFRDARTFRFLGM